MKGIGRFVVTEEALVEALHLPKGTRVVGVRGSSDPYKFDYEFTVEAEGMVGPLVGEAVPVAVPQYERKIAKCGHVVEVKLAAWKRK